ncbi:MAG: extracellular solute-binding protein [Dehalococcoidia bacterium]|nr:extracellular solute-binding protein [Dehalococcoidia bacterium]
MNPTRLTLPLALLAAVVVGAGCGSDDSEDTSGSSKDEAQAGEAQAGASTPDLDGQKLVFVNYGGDTLVAAEEGWLDPFSAESGVQIATDSPSDPAKVKAMVEAGRTTWDVIDLDAASGGAQCGTLFEERENIDISAIDPKYISDLCGVPIMVQAIALVYNNELYGDNPPTKVTDFMDTEAFPGKRIIFNYAVGGIEPILLADGVEPDELFPLDYDRAASAIERLGGDLVFHAELAQQEQALQSGDFAMCLCYTGRAAVTAEKGADIGVVWDSAYMAWDALYAIKGSEYPEAQEALMNYIATPEAQAAFTETLPYGPTTPSSEPQISDLFKEFLPDFHEEEIGTRALYDAQWWIENADKAFAEWTAMTAG